MSSEAKPECAPTARFGNRASEYVAARPSYPAAAIDAIVEGVAESCGVSFSELVIADVGAGTGISTRLLAQRGVRVIAIEPNAPMREAGISESTPGVEWRDGSAEATGLGDASVHGVVCAQAFHWFRAEEALHEFARVLVPGGRVVLMWNNRDERDAFTTRYERAIRKAAAASGLAVPYLDSSKPLKECRLFVNQRVVEVEYAHVLDREAIIKRAASVSYVPKSGAVYDELVRELLAAFDEHVDGDGNVTMRYVTSVYIGEKSR